MKCETYGIFKSFSNLRVLYCTQNFFKYIKLDQNTPSIFRVLQDSGIMIVFKWFFLFKRFSITFCILKPNRFFSIGWVSPLKAGPQSKKGVRKKKWFQNSNNTSFNQGTTEIFWPIVNPIAFENVVLTWPLTFWFLFTGLFFIFKSPFLSQKWIFLVNFIRILWFMWDLVLVLFNSHKDVVSGKILAFGSILGFPGITWVQKWTKTFNFGYVPFLLKHLILKGCLNTVFFLWGTTSGWNISKGMPYLGEKGLRNPPKGGFMDVALPRKHLNIYNLTATNAKLIKLTRSMYLHKKLNLAEDWGVTHRA